MTGRAMLLLTLVWALTPSGTQAQPAPPTATVGPSPRPLSLLEAVTSALTRHPALALARAAVAEVHADLMLARSSFDTTLSAALGRSRTVAPYIDGARGAMRSHSDNTNLSLGASKSWQAGTRLESSVTLARQDQRLLTPFNQSALVTVSVTQPILRGAGTVGAASTLHAAELTQAAAEDTLRHVAQQQAFVVILAYWDLVAAERELTVTRESQARAQHMLEESRTLVERDQEPRGDLRRLEASLAERAREVLDAHSARVRALHALHLTMGLDRADDTDAQTTDVFPAAGLPEATVEQLIASAMQARFDVKAAESTLRAAATTARGADHNTLPRVDVALSLGYAGGTAQDGVPAFFDTLGRNVQGVNAGASVSLEWPVENNAQRSVLVRADAQLTAAELTRAELSRTLRSEIAVAYDDLRFAVAALDQAARAEGLYASSLEDERYKLRAGLSTVIDVVLTEDLLTQATRARIATELSLAVALARLRLTLGALPWQTSGAANALAGVLNARWSDAR